MALEAGKRLLARQQPLRGAAILAGPAEALKEALTRLSALAPEFQFKAVVEVGGASGAFPEATHHVESWDALAPGAVAGDANVLVLAGALHSRLSARRLLTASADSGLPVLVFENGALRQMQIDDVVGRPLAAMDWTDIRTLIAGKRVLITGGGGSIGSELTRRVHALGPSRLCVLDASEYNLFRIGRDLPDVSLALADVRDPAAMQRWFARERPDIVFHAAALKQVPLVEAHPSEGVLTNVWGCRNVAQAAIAVGADVVFCSTDKAVNPSGMMGATKRLAEMYCQALDRDQGLRGGSRFVSVRLGNVLGSTGSVIPVFESQIIAGGPLTVTDPEVKRYFISVAQAADFLLQAGAVGFKEEAGRGACFVLDMGEQLPVVDLARELIRLNGLRPDVDIGITFVGLRPGEKLSEELIASDEWREQDPAAGVMAVAGEPRGLSEINEIIAKLVDLARQGADDAVAAVLRETVAPRVAETSEEALRRA